MTAVGSGKDQGGCLGGHRGGVEGLGRAMVQGTGLERLLGALWGCVKASMGTMAGFWGDSEGTQLE